MCGRYVILNGKPVLQSFAKLYLENTKDTWSGLPRYNASPGQQLPVIAFRNEKLTAQKMKWWLIPHWSKDGKINATTFNARAENLDQSKLFLPYFKSSRCLIPADAFYEWKKIEKLKQPICIRMKDEKNFYFAGLFSIWKNENDEEFPSFTIITTTPNKLMADIHNRMPVILPEKHYEQWLDPNFREIDKLKNLLVPYPPSKMEAFKVSSYMSNPRNEGEKCMDRIE